MPDLRLEKNNIWYISENKIMAKTDINSISREDIKKALSGMGQPVFRADQIFFWLYNKGVSDFSRMRNIPKGLQDALSFMYRIGFLELSERVVSIDKTEKFLFKLSDGNFIESVLIYAENRLTACLSSQVGCKFACLFCASGSRGFTRDLTTSEIICQITFLRRSVGREITNYVFMGMGEPLDNFDNVSKAIMIMNDPKGMNIGSRRITVSTCGYVPGIERLKDFKPQVNLSLSLHAANDDLRNKLVPVNSRYPLDRLMKVCREYIDKTGRVITLEYVMLKDENDSLKDADKLIKIAKRLKAKVNMIPYSAVREKGFQPTDEDKMEKFRQRLLKNKVNVTQRESKGRDIRAACGQLAGKAQDR